MPEDTVGFIGLGIMGRPMALNLLRAGYPLVVHNRTREKEEGIVSEGAESAPSPREVAERSEILLSGGLAGNRVMEASTIRRC